MKRRLALALAGLVAVLLLLQLVPVRRTNPPVVTEPQWDRAETRALAARACFDCHSHETRWPWYAHIAPASFLVAHDVGDGREQLDFSDWRLPKDPRDLVKDISEELHDGDMPPWYYRLFHPEARLSRTEIERLEAGLRDTVLLSSVRGVGRRSDRDEPGGEEGGDDGGDRDDGPR